MASNAPIAPVSSETPGTTTASTGNNNLSKDEVGWYFVEQYYTTLSKSPEKLHLFYSKRSQFVYGLEAEVANVSVGRQAIQERIKDLDFQDCKVRVSNVDSQASFENIVIQVIGETSNKSGEPKKFVQTFVLAQQPSGYFVLNDILRYIDEDTDDESAEAAEEPSAETVEEPEAAVESVAPVEPEETKAAEEAKEPEEAPVELEVAAVDEKLEEAAKDNVTTNGSVTEEAAESAPEDVKAPETKPAVPVVDPETTVNELAEEDAKETETPKDPTPTPVAKHIAAPVEPAAPPKPMTWASRAAAAAGPKPVVPLAKTPTPPVTSQNRAPAPAAPAPQPAPAAAAPVPATAPVTEAAKDNAGWQTAGSDSKRQNRPQSISNAPAEKDGTHGYVKYVTDKVQDSELRAALAAHGELAYFDINRQKNCAFVEYKTPEGCQAAVAANPHTVNGETIVVEPRRPKANAYGGGYGSGRGGVPRGRGGFDGNRSGNQGPRGNFPGQNRGRGPARGRGGAQSSNA